MEQRTKNKSNHYRSLIIKCVIAAAAAWFIYNEVFAKANVQDLFDEFTAVFRDGWKEIMLAGILILMLINWMVEAVKWKLMIRKI